MIHLVVSPHKGHLQLNRQGLSGTVPSEMVFVLREQEDVLKLLTVTKLTLHPLL